METKEQHNMRIASNLERKIEKRLTETNEERERHLNTEKERKSAARSNGNIKIFVAQPLQLEKKNIVNIIRIMQLPSSVNNINGKILIIPPQSLMRMNNLNHKSFVTWPLLLMKLNTIYYKNSKTKWII
ncbi:15429_t:CDS:2 [Acaulospora morrowiae]|uniref:15429_t:CDS:1 n=1 Tax=Acaulospora morrowiae TaxID=94023 RepID=A0A9N8ZI05_9GLOM|nr:15429_t:CDS:2 [Acaulospora morrowiae]